MKLWFFKYNFHQKHTFREAKNVHVRPGIEFPRNSWIFFRVKDSKQYVKIQFAVRQQLKYSESLKTPEFISTSVYTSLESWKMTLKDSKKLVVVVVYCTCIYVFGMECKFDQIFQLRDPFVKQGDGGYYYIRWSVK